MLLNKLSAYASIASFLMGVYLLVQQARGSAHASSLVNPLVWIFVGGLVMAGYMNFSAAKINARVLPEGLPGKGNNAAKSSSSLGRVTRASDERVYLGEGITREFLSGLREGHTDVQADKILEIYIGKWMRVAG